MGLGYFQVPYESKVLAYDNEKLPIELCQNKMLPIIKWDDGSAQNESLTILKKLDSQNELQWELLHQKDGKYVQDLILKIGHVVHSLAMPYWCWTPEFDVQSRAYFHAKKEIKRGPMHLLAQKRAEFEKELAPILVEVEEGLNPFFKRDTLTIFDIMIASHLWGLYLVPELQLPSGLHQYLQMIKHLTRFDYHRDFWATPQLTPLR